MNRTRQAVGLLVLVAVCVGAAAAGGAATYPRIEGWYTALAKPSWTPPNWVFGPVWIVLYIAMAVAAWLVWRQKGLPGSRRALALFALQLGFNVVWSWLFFGLRNPGLGFLDIIGRGLGDVLSFGRTVVRSAYRAWCGVGWGAGICPARHVVKDAEWGERPEVVAACTIQRGSRGFRGGRSTEAWAAAVPSIDGRGARRNSGQGRGSDVASGTDCPCKRT